MILVYATPVLTDTPVLLSQTVSFKVDNFNEESWFGKGALTGDRWYSGELLSELDMTMNDLYRTKGIQLLRSFTKINNKKICLLLGVPH